MLGEEVDEGRNRVQSKGVVGEINGVQVRQGQKRGQEMRQGGRDFGEQARGEDVGEVGDLARPSV